jgi:hypothetical protein
LPLPSAYLCDLCVKKSLPPLEQVEALCFGWIDGIRKSLDDIRYTIRFSTEIGKHLERYEY